MQHPERSRFAGAGTGSKGHDYHGRRPSERARRRRIGGGGTTVRC